MTRIGTIHKLVVERLAAQRFTYANEAELAAGVAEILGQPLTPLVRSEYERERPLAGLADDAREVAGIRVPGRGKDRIDGLLNTDLGNVGVECKVAGSHADVLAQLLRYADSPEVDALVLVTSRSLHRILPEDARGKPLGVVYVGGL